MDVGSQEEERKVQKSPENLSITNRVARTSNGSGSVLACALFLTLGAWIGPARAALETTPAWTFNVNQDLATVGWDVATAGDINGDGYSDVIVSGHSYSNGESAEGKAWLFLGSPTGLATSAAWSREGGQTLAYFGESIGPAGDVNGDGYDDVIIGARGYNNGQTGEGRAYVFHGSASGLSTTPNWTQEGNSDTAWFGGKVSTAGDVNGDGYSDVVVAAYNYTGAQFTEGKVYLYLGSASGLNTNAAWTEEGNLDDARFGQALSCAGDVNADGYDDVIIGTFGWSNGQSSEGMVRVYLGTSSGLSNTQLWTIEGGVAGFALGQRVACAGDVNGDGYSDVATNGGSFPANVYIYYGGAAGPDDTYDRRYQADTNTLGRGMFTAGDVNGDGFADLVIGDESADSGNAGNGSEGAIFLYQGSATGLPTTPVNTIYGEEVDSGTYGRATASAGDVNGDGFTDVLVGDWAFDNDNAGSEGKVYLYLGTPSQNEGSVDWTDESNQAGAAFGISCASGDWNADGFSDLAVGAWHQDAGNTDEGVAYVYFGNRNGLSTTSSWSADSDQDGANYGYSLGTAGDVNGDGYEDLLVGAPIYDNGEANEGRVWLYLGSSTGPSTGASWRGDSDQANSWFGWSLSSAGDVNGDGYSDVVIGIPNWDGSLTDEGRVELYLGSAAGLPSVASWSYNGSETNASLGFSVASAGDVNGDGYSDIVVGAPDRSSGQTDEGVAWVFYGSATGLPASPNRTLQANQANSNFGISVAGAGDVNGDGYGDVIVGASNWTNGQSLEGAVFAFLGSASGISNVAAWNIEGGQDGAHRGEDVAAAGDVDNDGYDDITFGAPYHTTTLTEEGRGVVYFGGSTGLNTSSAWVVNGGQANARCGAAVCSAGDINGDGFADVAIGMPDYDNAQDGEGRAVLYYGNEGGLDRAVQQLRSDGVTPIALHGFSDQHDTVRLSGYARTAMGRGQVQLQELVAQAGDPFPTGMPNTDGAWYDTGAPVSGTGSRIKITTGPLGALEASSAWHWRLRWRSDSPFIPWTPWFSPARGGTTETDFRTPANTSDTPLADANGAALRFARVWPNPFVESVSLGFALPAAADVRLTVHDVSGRRIATVVDDRVDAGLHTAAWDGRSVDGARVASGVYFVRLAAAGIERQKKIVLSK